MFKKKFLYFIFIIFLDMCQLSSNILQIVTRDNNIKTFHFLKFQNKLNYVIKTKFMIQRKKLYHLKILIKRLCTKK